MSNIRRIYLENAPVFITCVCYKRAKFLYGPQNKELLRAVMREVKKQKIFKLHAYVILDDHFHIMITPQSSYNFSKIMQSIKLRFSLRYKAYNPSLQKEQIWQHRFWDHLIRNEEDFRSHLDYIHYNPVKHHYVNDPANYIESSFLHFFNKNYYPDDWGKIIEPKNIAHMSIE